MKNAKPCRRAPVHPRVLAGPDPAISQILPSVNDEIAGCWAGHGEVGE